MLRNLSNDCRAIREEQKSLKEGEDGKEDEEGMNNFPWKKRAACGVSEEHNREFSSEYQIYLMYS